jgi:hypothetical protein
LKDKKPGRDWSGFLICRCQQTNCVAIRRRKPGALSSATLLRIAFVKRRRID